MNAQSSLKTDLVRCHFPGALLLTRSLRIWLGLKDSTQRETDGDRSTGLGIASAVRAPVTYDEGAEAGDLDLAALAQAFANDGEDRFDHFAGFLFRRTDALVDQVHEIGFGHALRIYPHSEGCCVDVRVAQSSIAVPV
jgi:hypothetical protein